MEKLPKISELSESGNTSKGKPKEIAVSSWKKFSRIVRKSIHNNPLFNDLDEGNGEVRLADKIKEIQKNDVYVVDIASWIQICSHMSLVML